MLDSFQHFFNVNGFCYVPIAPCFNRLFPVTFHSIRSESNYGYMFSFLVRLYNSCCLKSVHFWHHDIHQDKVGYFLPGYFNTLLTVGRFYNLISKSLKKIMEQFHISWFIFDDQYCFWHISFLLSPESNIQIGSVKVNLLPLFVPPLSIHILPPCFSTMLRVIANPNPVPGVFPLIPPLAW